MADVLRDFDRDDLGLRWRSDFDRDDLGLRWRSDFDRDDLGLRWRSDFDRDVRCVVPPGRGPIILGTTIPGML